MKAICLNKGKTRWCKGVWGYGKKCDGYNTLCTRYKPCHCAKCVKPQKERITIETKLDGRTKKLAQIDLPKSRMITVEFKEGKWMVECGHFKGCQYRRDWEREV